MAAEEGDRGRPEWTYSWAADDGSRNAFVNPLNGSVRLVKDFRFEHHDPALKLELQPSHYGKLEAGSRIYKKGDRSILLFFSLVNGGAPGPEHNQSFLNKFYDDHLISEILVSEIDETVACHSSVIMTRDSLSAVSCALVELVSPDRSANRLYIPRIGGEIRVQ